MTSDATASDLHLDTHNDVHYVSTPGAIAVSKRKNGANGLAGSFGGVFIDGETNTNIKNSNIAVTQEVAVNAKTDGKYLTVGASLQELKVTLTTLI